MNNSGTGWIDGLAGGGEVANPSSLYSTQTTKNLKKTMEDENFCFLIIYVYLPMTYLFLDVKNR